MEIIQGVSVKYCHFQLDSALAIANLYEDSVKVTNKD